MLDSEFGELLSEFEMVTKSETSDGMEGNDEDENVKHTTNYPSKHRWLLCFCDRGRGHI